MIERRTLRPPTVALNVVRGAAARQLRIIGGRWRGRRWRFAHDDIRPTPDRVRETLFNWLQGRVQDALCLDLFAGSGALGLEALSRGARRVDFVDRAARAIDALRQTLATLASDGDAPARLHCLDARRFLADPAATSYDLVFIDPPYAEELQSAAASLLEGGGWLRDGALIYVEARRGASLKLPANWRPLKSGKAGEVGYHLYERSAVGAAS